MSERYDWRIGTPPSAIHMHLAACSDPDCTMTRAESAAIDPDLGKAWAEAEAALPEGWRMDGLRAVGDRRALSGWVARAVDPRLPDDDPASLHFGTIPLTVGEGPTPAAALHALAARLAAVPEGEQPG